MTTQKIVLGSFTETPAAHQAIAAMKTAGVPIEAISVLLPDSRKDDFARIDHVSKAPEGAALGGATGLALGALAAGLTAIAGISVPGLGLLAAGPLVAVLAGAGAGGAIGGSFGAMVGLGFSEHEAKFHTDVLENGGVVVTVTSENETDIAIAKRTLEMKSVRVESSSGMAAQVR